MKFFMVGDRYDNDCEPFLEIGLPSDGKVGVGTCRLLSGKRAWIDCPPAPRKDAESGESSSPARPTLYVCDMLAQVAHILHNEQLWSSVDFLEVTPPVLLETMGGTVYFRNDKNKLEALLPRFKDLSWARGHMGLQHERGVQDIIDQIERDLAVCDIASLSSLFGGLRNQIANWWNQAIQDDDEVPSEGGAEMFASRSATTLLKGTMAILEGMNEWRYTLRCSLLAGGPGGAERLTLEWLLGSFFLKCADRFPLTTDIGILEPAEGEVPKGIEPIPVLHAIPYSEVGIAIVKGIQHEGGGDTVEQRTLHEWLKRAQSLR